jgi:hypothetical protein
LFFAVVGQLGEGRDSVVLKGIFNGTLVAVKKACSKGSSTSFDIIQSEVKCMHTSSQNRYIALATLMRPFLHPEEETELTSPSMENPFQTG